MTANGRLPAEVVAGLRGLARPAARNGAPAAAAEHCDLCGRPIPDVHRHLLHLDERRIVCACEVCRAARAGEASFRPVGTRTLWLEDFALSEELWAAFQIPIGLAFFFHNSTTGGVVGLYPSPAGATECELHLDSWNALVALNPILAELEPDGEALIVNRLGDPPQHAIAPIDECYRLVGLIKSTWQGISGGTAVTDAVPSFFAGLRAAAGR